MILLNNTYYTKKSIASQLIYLLEDIFNIDKYDVILDPSAGDGVFTNILNDKYPNKTIGVDILPSQNPLILHEDFLIYNTDFLKNKNVITISNVPFSPISLLNNFVKKICNISNTFALILPISFKKPSRINLIDPYFHLIEVIDIPKYSYEFKNISYDVKTAFFIYQKRDFKRLIHIKNIPLDYYQFNIDKYDIVIRRVGGKSGDIFLNDNNISYNKNTNYFIKLNDGYDIYDFINRYNKYKYKLHSHINNSIVRSLSKNYLIDFLNSLYIQNPKNISQ